MGPDGWYNWRLEHWGTKWGAYDGLPLEECTAPSGKRKVKLSFSSAWSPLGDPIWHALAARFPTLRFTVHYYEAGMGFKGKIKIRPGQPIEFEHSNTYRGSRGG